jgi:hypothetical protein
MASSSSNGTAFGLTFRQHDNRHMQQILRQYRRLPENPADRTELYIGLVLLQVDLPTDEWERIRDWLKGNGRGEFPTPVTLPPEPEPEPMVGTSFQPIGGVQYNRERMTGGSENDGSFDVLMEDEEMEIARVEEHFETGFDRASNQNRHRNRVQDSGNELQLQDGFIGYTSPWANGDDFDSESDESTSSQSAKAITETVECSICMESYAESYFPTTTKITSNCAHGHDGKVCLSCIRMSISSALKEGALHRIICPLCPEKLSKDEIRQYASPDMMIR